MAKMFITITGTNFEYGSDYLEKEMIVILVKKPDNKYDREVIKVELKPFGKIWYVANNVKTVIGECYSAGWLYDKIGDKAKADVCFVTPSGVIAKIKNSKKD